MKAKILPQVPEYVNTRAPASAATCAVASCAPSSTTTTSANFFFFEATATTKIYTTYDTLSLHDALPISFWENNPWNPGTRLVMSRIPFDRDAVPLSPPEVRRLVLTAGFRLEQAIRFLF